MPSDPIERLNLDVEVYGIPQAPGMPPMTESYFHIRRRQDGASGTAVLGLPAYEGAPGPAGPPAAIHKGDRTTSQLAGIEATLGPANTNWAYRNVDTNDMYVWTGGEWAIYVDAFGAEGPPGPAPTLLDGTVKYDGVVVSGAALDVTGPDGGPYQISIDMPTPDAGPEGPVGPAGPILTSIDVVGTPVAGQVLRYDSVLTKLVWSDVPGAVEEYVVPPSGFPTVSKSSSDVRQQLVAANIPAKTYPYRLDFAGGVDVDSKLGHQIDVEIRLSDPVTGQLVGYGKGQDGEGWREVAFRAHSNVAIEPGSSSGVIAAGTAVTVYVSAVKKAGILFGWGVRNDLAQLRIRLTQVA